MALAVSKLIEVKTNTSLRAFLTQCKKVTNARLLNKLTGKVITLPTSIPDHLTNLPPNSACRTKTDKSGVAIGGLNTHDHGLLITDYFFTA